VMKSNLSIDMLESILSYIKKYKKWKNKKPALFRAGF
jgi:hypothetical protein